MKHWNWSETFPDYTERLERMAEFITLGFHEYRVNQLSLIPKGWDYV